MKEYLKKSQKLLFKSILLLSIIIIGTIASTHKLEAAMEASTYISKNSIYDFQSLFLTIKFQGDYNSISSAGYLDETLLNDFDIKNVSVSTSSSLLENGQNSYSRIMRYEIIPLRAGQSMIPAISILYDDGTREGYISTEAMSVRVYSKKSLTLHLLLVVLATTIVVVVTVSIVVGIRRKIRENNETIKEL